MTQEASCDTGSAGDSEESLERYQAILDAFVEVAANVEELGDLDNLLRLVARSICDLTGIRRCALYLLGNDGLLHGRVGHGPDANIDRAVQQLVTGWTVDGLTRELIEGKSPILIRDASTDPRTVQEIMQRWQVRSLLAVPLVFSGEVIGAIHLDNIEEEHAYSDLDVDVAQTFASLASSAIAQAAMAARNRERAAVNERQRDHLEQLSRIHANLTEAVLRGDDIPTVLGRLVDLIEKTVVLRDRDFAVMAWSAPDGEHSHDDLEIHAELLSASWEASEQVE
ncbi:GAF domain-containing protein, partial [Ilumatobacter sp.]|uniref:GAF domain-containing protein n=1 Tax=Ilumatobacter sp. TaxID=1967498 RepID=UPI003750458A